MNLKTGVSRKQTTPSFPKNKYFLPTDTHTCVWISEGKKCSFSDKFGVLCFLVTPVLRLALLLYYELVNICLYNNGLYAYNSNYMHMNLLIDLRRDTRSEGLTT